MTLEDKIIQYATYVGKMSKTINKTDFSISRLGTIDILSKDPDVRRLGCTAEDINNAIRELVAKGKLTIVGQTRRLMVDQFGNQLYTIDSTGKTHLHFDNYLTLPEDKDP